MPNTKPNDKENSSLKNEIFFSSEDLDYYLKELAKEYRRLSGKSNPAEVILVGGAAILAGYTFRENTSDVDAYFVSSSAMKEAADRTGDRLNLPYGWFNSDFVKTKSFSPKITQYSQHYKTFSNIVEFRIVSAEHLIAMKLMSGRPYKHDLSDVGGILLEHQKRGIPISYGTILHAVEDLYEDITRIPKNSMIFLQDIFKENNMQDLRRYIDERKKSEQEALKALKIFSSEYKGVLREDNLSDILSRIQSKGVPSRVHREYDDD